MPVANPKKTEKNAAYGHGHAYESANSFWMETSYDNFPLGQMVDKGLRVQMGQATVHNYIDERPGFVDSGKLVANDIISHRLPLAKAPHGYSVFNKKEENCTKVVLNPWD